MNIDKLINKISGLNNKPNSIMNRQICVIGAAVIDLIALTPALPIRGQDIEINQQAIHIGGCAFNIALALHRLGLASINALPIGEGIWADQINSFMQNHGISSIIKNPNGDNGWCIALVEPDGERTFLSIAGVENLWSEELLQQIDLQDNALIYICGYQLASATSEIIISWLENLSIKVDLFIDFGPRIGALKPKLLTRILKLKPIISVNRQEAQILGMQEDVPAFAQAWYAQHQCPLIIRLDQDGAYCYNLQQQGYISAFPAKVVDTVGAGDSHAAGVLAGLSANWSLSEAVSLGNAIASNVVTKNGGDSSPSTSELLQYLKSYGHIY